MASSSDQAALQGRPRCEQYGLMRVELDNDPFSMPDFMNPFVGETEWTDWAITRVEDGPAKNLYADNAINTYATSVERGGYITYGISTTKGEKQGAPRTTDMKHRDLIIDNWLSAGGSLNDLRYIGTSIIVNTFGVQATKYAFLIEHLNYAVGGQVELYPADELYNTCFMTNPFVAGLDRLAAILGRKIKRFVFITVPDTGGGLDHDPYKDELYEDEPICHLVMEMAAPDEPDVSLPGRSLNISPEWRELLADLSFLDWTERRVKELQEKCNEITKAFGGGDNESFMKDSDYEDYDEDYGEDEDKENNMDNDEDHNAHGSEKEDSDYEDYDEDYGEDCGKDEDEENDQGNDEDHDKGGRDMKESGGEVEPLFSDDVNIE